MSSQWGLQKSLRGLVSHEHTAYLAVFELFLTQWIMVISKVCKSYSLNHLILRNVALQIFEVLIQILLNVNLFLSKFSWHSCSMWDKLEWLNWFGNFSVRGYLPLIQNDFVTRMHGLAVYLKERLRFAQDLSVENSTDSYLRFWLALRYLFSYFFFLNR